MTIGTAVKAAGISVTPRDPNAMVWVGYLQDCTNLFNEKPLGTYSGLSAAQDLAQTATPSPTTTIGVSARLPSTWDSQSTSPVHSVCVARSDNTFVRVAIAPRLHHGDMTDEAQVHAEREWLSTVASQLSNWLADPTMPFAPALLSGTTETGVWSEPALQSYVRSSPRTPMALGTAAISTSSDDLSESITEAIVEHRAGQIFDDAPRVRPPSPEMPAAAVRLRDSKQQVVVLGEDLAVLEVLSSMIAIPGIAASLVGGAYAPNAGTLCSHLWQKLGSPTASPPTLTQAGLAVLARLKPNEPHRAIAVERGETPDSLRISLTTRRPGMPETTLVTQEIAPHADVHDRARAIMLAIGAALDLDVVPQAAATAPAPAAAAVNPTPPPPIVSPLGALASATPPAPSPAFPHINQPVPLHAGQ